MHHFIGLHVELPKRIVWYYRLPSTSCVIFSPFIPWHPYAARYRAPHVVRRIEIAAPSPVVLINSSLSEVALLTLSTIITLLHLLHLPTFPLRYEYIPKGCRFGICSFSNWVQALFQQISTVTCKRWLPASLGTLSSWPGTLISLWWWDQ